MTRNGAPATESRPGPGEPSAARRGPLNAIRAAAFGAALLTAAACAPATPRPASDSTRRAAVERIRAALAASPPGFPLRGVDGWLYITPEVELLVSELDWEVGPPASSAPARPVSVATIADFRAQLAARGIDLLFVPIPAKLTVYPDKLLPDLAADVPRLDGPEVELLAALERAGVATVDLTGAFLSARRHGEPEPLFPVTGTHWSPTGCALAAREVATAVRARWPELAARPPSTEAERSARVERVRVEVRGDLLELHPEPRPETREKLLYLSVTAVDGASGGGSRDGEPAPILLLGDSNLDEYRDARSGFADHLDAELGRPSDQIAISAGSTTTVRRRLAQQPERLDGKKLVIWMVAARYFVHGEGWEIVELGPRAR